MDPLATTVGGVAGSLIAALILTAVRSGLAHFRESRERRKVTGFESVSEFWYVGVGRDVMRASAPDIDPFDKDEDVMIRGHLSPYAPVVPGSPLDSLGMHPEIEDIIDEEGKGSRIDGMDVLWNDQVFLPPFESKMGNRFFYAGLYDRFGDADVHIPLYIDKNAENIEDFRDLCVRRHVGYLAEVRGKPRMVESKAFEDMLFLAFPQLKQAKQEIGEHHPHLRLPVRRTVVLEVTSLKLHPDLKSGFLSTLWISTRKEGAVMSEIVDGRYVNMMFDSHRESSDEHFKRISEEKPDRVTMIYEDRFLPKRPPGNAMLRDIWPKL
jgi:hypothetical protein